MKWEPEKLFIISIPYGSIKAIIVDAVIFVATNISIPYGSIKAQRGSVLIVLYYAISIPYGSIKATSEPLET